VVLVALLAFEALVASEALAVAFVELLAFEALVALVELLDVALV